MRRATGPRRFITALLVAILGFGVQTATAEPHPAPTATARAIDPTRLAAFVDGVVQTAMWRDGIAGVNVAIVDRSGVLLIRSYGIAAPGRPVTPDTLFPIQSISKTMVWIALMQLVQEGKIGLEDPVNRYLPPSLQVPDEGFHHPIRIWNLMSHTPGFEDSAFGHLFVDRPERLSPLDAYLQRYRVHRVREPGRVVVYSNYGGALGGAIVAHVTGLAWEDYAEQKILRPLGMDATFRQPYPAALASARGLPAPMTSDMATRLTDGFHLQGGQLAPARREYTSDVPAGAAVATPKAMAAYMQALLDPDRMQQAGVLSAQTLRDMREPLFRGPAGFGDMRHGFGALSVPGGDEAFGHNGGSTYQSANMALIPSLGIGIFISSNTANGYGLAQRLRQAIVSEFFDAQLPPPVYGPRSFAEARSYAGDYRNLQRPFFRTEHGVYDLLIDTSSVSAASNGDVQIGSLLGSSRRFVPLGGGVYRDAAGPDRIAFRISSTGSGRLYEPYSDLTFERIGYFESPGWAALVLLLTALAAAAAMFLAVRDVFVRRARTLFEHYSAWSLGAAALAWLVGLGLFLGGLVDALSAADVNEIQFTYPANGLVWACWSFAAAAILTAASVPGLVMIGGPSRGWRKAVHPLVLAVFLVCSWQLWQMSFLGFSGW